MGFFASLDRVFCFYVYLFILSLLYINLNTRFYNFKKHVFLIEKRTFLIYSPAPNPILSRLNHLAHTRPIATTN